MCRHTRVRRCTYALTNSPEQRREEFVPGRGVVEINRQSVERFKRRISLYFFLQRHIPPLFIHFWMSKWGNILFKSQMRRYDHRLCFGYKSPIVLAVISAVLLMLRARICVRLCCTCTSPRLPERPDGIVQQSP